MIASDVRDFLEKLGYDVQTSLNHREHMQLWREWYRGKVDSFHNYVIYNGIKEVKKTKNHWEWQRRVVRTGLICF